MVGGGAIAVEGEGDGSGAMLSWNPHITRQLKSNLVPLSTRGRGRPLALEPRFGERACTAGSDSAPDGAQRELSL